MKAVQLLIVFVISSISIVILNRKAEQIAKENINSNLTKLEIKLTGTISDKTPIANNCRVIVLDVTQSSEELTRFPPKILFKGRRQQSLFSRMPPK